jgi:electron transport complex protein RnfA
MEYFLLIIGAMFTNNFVLSQFLGCCPFLGVSKKTDTALGMGLAVTFVMGVASIITWCVQKVLVLLGVEYLQTIAFILVIAALVQLIEMVLKKYMPSLYSALGVYLPLITTNCAVLGVAILNIDTYGVAGGISLLQSFLNGVFSGIGFLIAILLLAGVREKMDQDSIPKPFRGFPITLIAASILSMAFVAFGGLISSSGAISLLFN